MRAVKQGKIQEGTDKDIARADVGLAIRLGASRPDISSTDAFRQSMLAAKSVAYKIGSGSGNHFVNVMRRLGITDQMLPKIKTVNTGRVGELIAKGEAELAVQNISELLPVAGIEVVGPFPQEIRQNIVQSTAVGSRANDPVIARDLVGFLVQPEAIKVILATGLGPL